MTNTALTAAILRKENPVFTGMTLNQIADLELTSPPVKQAITRSTTTSGQALTTRWLIVKKERSCILFRFVDGVRVPAIRGPKAVLTLEARWWASRQHRLFRRAGRR